MQDEGSLDSSSLKAFQNKPQVLLGELKNICIAEGYEFSEELVSDIPKRWEKHGDLVLFSAASFNHTVWLAMDQQKLWNIVAKALKVDRIAKQDAISGNGFRSPQITMLKGSSTKVVHTDNRIRYSFDISKCMFSSGNVSEKLRLAKLNCKDEVIVDLFAGIGYFTIPLLVHAKAKHVHACDWNPDAVQALKENLKINKVSDRCAVYEGDNRKVCPAAVADRVVLGLIPSARDSFYTACRALNPHTGGVMHVHENVTSGFARSTSEVVDRCEHSEITCNRKLKREWLDWAAETASVMKSLLQSAAQPSGKDGRRWSVSPKHIERVKSYAPHVDHLVLDLHCTVNVINDVADAPT